MQEGNHLEVEAHVSQVTSTNEKDISDLLQEDLGSSAIASDFIWNKGRIQSLRPFLLV